MTGRPESNQPDWVIPAVLSVVGAVVAIALVASFVVLAAPSGDDSLAGQMERWTTCLRSEGAPVPLVESIGDEGFRITVDDAVLDASFDHDSLAVAFDLCLDDAPDGVQTIASVVDGFSSLPFGVDELGWLSPLLFEIGGGEEFGDAPLDELCAQLFELEFLLPDAALEMLELCVSEPDV